MQELTVSVVAVEMAIASDWCRPRSDTHCHDELRCIYMYADADAADRAVLRIARQYSRLYNHTFSRSCLINIIHPLF